MKLIQLAICFALALIASLASGQTDTTFTYQGELMESGSPANGSYNMEFSLWNADIGGSQLGTVSLSVPVVNGRFTAELDFGGDAFDNSARWLAIEINGVPLSQRNLITRTPYALQTRGIFVDDAAGVGIGHTFPIAKLDVATSRNVAVAGYTNAGGFASKGISGTSTAFGGTGVYGEANFGLAAFGVLGVSSGGEAGHFSGDVNVVGTLAKSAGSFKIDHPLDPETKYLSHSFVESPDMMNVYNGNIVTDADGYATVTLPEWFEVLNRDFRYQLTVIDDANSDTFVLAKVVERIAVNRFRIRTSAPNTEVSWLVTGIRQDPYAESNRIQVEEMKPAELRGLYRHPELYGRTQELREESIKLSAMQRERLESTEAAK